MVEPVDLSGAAQAARSEAEQQARSAAYVKASLRAFKGIYNRPQIITLAKLGLKRQQELIDESEKK